MLSPVLETAVENSKDKFGKELDLMTVDTDQERELAAQYRVSALPSGVSNPLFTISSECYQIRSLPFLLSSLSKMGSPFQCSRERSPNQK